MTDPDALRAGPERRPRGALAVLAAGALLAAGLLGDAHVREREVDALLARAASGVESVQYADGRVRGVLRHAGPALQSPQVRPEVRDSLRDLVRREAGGQVEALRSERRAAADVRVLPWHGPQREARSRWLAYLDVRVAYLESVSADFGALYRPHPELGQARDGAEQAYARAAPRRAGQVREVFGP